MENQTIESQVNEEQDLNQLSIYAADLLVNKDKNAVEVVNALKEKGMDEETATVLVSTLIEKIEDNQSSRANKDMIYGALWCIGGIVVTVFTYSASSGGDRYIVAWGAILFGAIQFFRGVSKKV